MAKNPVTISVVVPCHNDDPYIEECLNALSNQSLRPSEIIVCDDASCDRTLEVVRSWQASHPDMLLIIVKHDDHVGISRNFNSGLLASSGDYVSMVAADDYWKPRKLEQEYAQISEKGVSWAYSKVELRMDTAGENGVYQPFQGTSGDYEGDIFSEIVHRQVSPRCFLIERRVLMETGLFDESIGMYEDWDLKMRLSKRCPIAYVREANVIYRQHGGGEHHAPMYRHMGEISKVLRKNKSLVPGNGVAVFREVMQTIWPKSTMSNDLDRAARETAVSSLDLSYDPVSIKSNGEGLIFLISLPRSGSTMLQRVLGSHPDIHTTAEPWVMLHPLYALKHTGLEAEYDASTCRQALGDFMKELPTGEEGYYTAVRKMACSLYRQATVSAGKSRFLDKTPRYFNVLPELMQAFPKAKFVLLLRNPLAVLASVLDTWFDRNIKAYESSSHFRDMLEGPRLLAEAIETFGDNLIVTRYEDVVADTQAEVHRLCEFLELPFFEPMLEYGARPAPTGECGDPQKVNVHNAPVEDYVETWKGLLSLDGIRQYAARYLDSIGDKVLSQLGYSLTTLSLELEACPLPTESESAKIEAGSSASLVSAGEAAYQAGDINMAEAHFMDAYAMDSTDIVACNNLVVLYWESGNAEQALRYLEIAMQLDSTNREVVVNGGQILSAYGYKAEAAGLYEAYLAICQNDKEVLSLYEQAVSDIDTETLADIARPDPEQVATNSTDYVERVGLSLPDNAPIIMIADEAVLSRNSEQEDKESKATSGGNGKILVTAIVSTYNSEKYIDGCLQDLMSQTIADRLEVIVVDSGSQQNERAVVERYQKEYSNIRYFRTEERETIYSAWNRAIHEARGEFVSNANTDDRHSSDAYEKMVATLQSKPDIALVYADSFVTSTVNATFESAAVEGKFQWPEFDARLLFSVCYIGPQPMWRRSLHEKYGYFDAQMKVAGDYDFWLRMASNERFHHIAEELGLYLLSSSSVEHAYADDGVKESESARQLNWPIEWGERPAPGGSYLVTIDNKDSCGGDKEKPEPLVSIIMPTKNRLELLGRALDSVIAQTYRRWELVIVNDGGNDVAPEVESRASSGRIRCIKLEQSVGQAAARNIALQEAKGEIICYLDDDDVYLQHHLDTVVTALTREGRPFIYTDAVVVSEQYDNGMLRETGERSNPYQHDEYSRDLLLVNNYIPINTWAHWKSCLDEVGVFDASLNCYEDWEFLLRFSARYNFTHLRKTTVEVMCRVDRVDSVTGQRLSESADAFRTIYQRHGDGLPEHLVRERSKRLRALEFNAEKQRQVLLDATVSDGGGCAEDRNESGYVSDRQRLQVTHEQFLRRIEEFGYELPSIHLIMIDIDSDAAKIADTIDSLDQQIYTGWGLSIISTAPSPNREFDSLPMLEWIQSDDVGQSFIDAARQSECGWVGSVIPGDKLEPDALSVFVDYINRNPGWKFIYSDEDCVDVSGNQLKHKFKPDINPDYLCSSPYAGNLSLVHRDMLEQISSDIGIPVASFFDLALKVLEQYGASSIGHVPALLYHQLQENECREARDTWVKPVLEAYVRRNDIDAGVLSGTAAGTCMIDYGCSGSPGVCIAIYAGCEIERVEHTVASLLNKTAYSNWMIRVGVDKAYAPQLEKYQSDQLSIDSLDKDAGRCAYFDSLAQTIDTDYMVFMDPGVVALQTNWLERLLAQGQRPEVGVVGVRLLSPQKRVVHAGILTGIGSFAVGGCIGEGDTLEQEGYMQRSQVVQNLSAVSSACMLVERSLYQSLQGFDAGIAVQMYRDVDFCLRVRETGKRIVWTPFVTMLTPDERLDTYSGDDGISRVEKDARQLTSTWLQSFARDPAYNRNLTLARADFSRETDFRPVWDPNVPDLPRITGCGFGSYGTWAYRVAQPLDALSAAGKARYSHVPFKGSTLDRMPSAVEMERIHPDVLLLQNSLHDNCLDSLRQYRKSNNMLMVLGQDDLMFAIPPKSSYFKTGYKDIKKRLRTCLSLVDRLVVTGEPLADELSGFISDIRIVPNHLDARIWGELESRRGCGLKPRVGWAGAMQHHGDLEILAHAVRETADEVDWIFMGLCPEFLRPYVKEVHEYVAFSAYPAALAKLNLDLAVAPLERNRFNRCKSNLRILEYGAMGWPVIATDIEPYQGAPVQLVGNQTQAWVNAIRDHINELDATWKAGDTLRQWVRDNHLLQGHLDDWLEALDSASGSHCQSLTPDKASGL